MWKELGVRRERDTATYGACPVSSRQLRLTERRRHPSFRPFENSRNVEISLSCNRGFFPPLILAKRLSGVVSKAHCPSLRYPEICPRLPDGEHDRFPPPSVSPTTRYRR